jgi:hypothetical protein
MGNELLTTGMDFVCAALTLVYIARLLCEGWPMGSRIEVACGVAKVSLRGQQIARRLR